MRRSSWSLASSPLERWPGRRGRLLSALALAVALAFRPQEIVFLPRWPRRWMRGPEVPKSPGRGRSFPWPSGRAVLAVALVLAFAPLLLSGQMDDFVHTLRVPIHGTYSQCTWFSFSVGLAAYLRDPWTVGVLTAGVLLAVAGPADLQRPARTWSLALLGVLFYKPMSPFPHPYLDQPILLILAINLAPLVAWLLTTAASPGFSASRPSRRCSRAACRAGPSSAAPPRSLQALGPLARGEDPVDAAARLRGSSPAGSGRAASTPGTTTGNSWPTSANRPPRGRAWPTSCGTFLFPRSMAPPAA